MIANIFWTAFLVFLMDLFITWGLDMHKWSDEKIEAHKWIYFSITIPPFYLSIFTMFGCVIAWIWS